jgi:dihydrolipoamide dehydrogenase
MNQYDVVVIGSGPGGYVAAIRCAQLGFKTAIIERYNSLGGTCLNVGCIPSKALLDSSEHFYNAQHHFKTHGIDAEGVKVNFTQMIQRKTEVVRQTADGVKYLMKKNKIDTYYGHGSFISNTKVAVKQNDGKTIELDSKYIIIATGSKASSLPNVAIDKKRIITSTEALSLSELPKSMIVIGGGVIGCELASVYARLGTKVQIIEYMDGLIPGMDKDLANELQKVMKKLNVEMFFNHKVTGAIADNDAVMITANDKDGKEQTYQAEYCLVAVGRRAYTDNLALEQAGVIIDERGKVIVNEHLQTSVANIYAIGDVIRGAMLAHKAEEEGVFVAEVIAGQKPHINYNLIPGVVYTWPEVAAVGFTEQQLAEKNIPYKKGTYPFKALGRARAAMESDGFVKILAHKETDEVLGVHMIGPRVADVIAEAVVAMEFRASAEDLFRISHAHPTFAEAVKEAAIIASEGRGINI